MNQGRSLNIAIADVSKRFPPVLAPPVEPPDSDIVI